MSIKLGFGISEAKAKAQEIASNTTLDIKSGACLISVDVQGACGERTLADSKSMLDGEVLESNLLSGTKLRWFPSDELRFVSTKSNAVRRTLSQHGIKFANGATLIPIATLPRVIEELEKLKSEFEDNVIDIKQRYPTIISSHEKANADIEKHIEKCVEEVDKFCGRFIFRVHAPMAIQPLFDGDEDKMASSAAETLLDEVAAEANRIWAKSLNGAEKATFKKTRPVLNLRDKLLNLSFLDPRIMRVALKFDEVIDSLPKTYPIEGGDFHKLTSFVLLCSDVDKLAAYGEGSDDLEEDDDAESQTNESLYDQGSLSESVSVIDTEVNDSPEQIASTVEENSQEKPATGEANEKSNEDQEAPLDDDSDIIMELPVSKSTSPQGGFVFDGW